MNSNKNLSITNIDNVVSENIHTPPTEGIGNSREEGVLKDPKI